MPDNSERLSAYHFTFLRHGESVGNAQGRIQGQSDFPLTDAGRLQAEALASFWMAEGKSFDSLISSPLLRCRETAEIIASLMGLDVVYDPLWMERDYGKLSGMQHAQAVQIEGRPLYANPYQPVGEDGESLWELYLRGGQAVSSLLRLEPGRILVVSHGGILNMALYAILGIAPQAYLRGARFIFENAAFAEMSYIASEDIWRVEALNERNHWQQTK